MSENSKIKLISQEDRSGCGIACVAMVTGKTYKEVREVWIANGGDPWLLEAVGNGAGIRSDQIRELINELGTPNGVKPNIIIGSQPIIRTIRGPMGWHFIVIDGDGDVFDPAGDVKEEGEAHNLYSQLTAERELAEEAGQLPVRRESAFYHRESVYPAVGQHQFPDDQ
jgi:hypothetical protein